MSAAQPVRIAMWSGPRNISTALMRSWSARGDTAVWDEPFYACYLKRTGLPHPGAAEIIEAYETDPDIIIARLIGPAPDDLPVFYQKHMAHHLIDGVSLDWLDHMVNCLLVRDPREMLLSLSRVIAEPSVEQTGLPQQVMLMERIEAATGRAPAVLDARQVLEDPGRALRALCGHIGVPYTDRMLRWPSGPHPADGLWARHWYAAVESSTGFDSYRPRPGDVPPQFAGVFDQCRVLYDRLVARAMLLPEGQPNAPEV